VGVFFCFCLQSQDEITGVLDLVESILSRFGFNEYEVMLSTRPEKSVGTDEIWTEATDALVGKTRRLSISIRTDPVVSIQYDRLLAYQGGRTMQCMETQHGHPSPFVDVHALWCLWNRCTAAEGVGVRGG
jgi:threonyl-tRNA synthetase